MSLTMYDVQQLCPAALWPAQEDDDFCLLVGTLSPVNHRRLHQRLEDDDDDDNDDEEKEEGEEDGEE